MKKKIETLSDFAEYINASSNWPFDAFGIIKDNGWTELDDRNYCDIAYDPARDEYVSFNDYGQAVVHPGKPDSMRHDAPVTGPGTTLRATLRNILNGESVEVHSSVDNAACSYGRPVWEDDEGNAYCEVDNPGPLYRITDIKPK